MRELKLAARSLIRTPFITAIAVISLALGIGANAGIYSLMDRMLLSELPVQEPERLVNLVAPGPKPGSQSCGQAGGCDVVVSYPMLRDLQGFETPSVTGVAGHVTFGANLSFDGQSVSGQGFEVTGNYFPLLGVRPALGRLLDPQDDQTPGAHPVAVLSHDYWQRDLGGDPAVLNSTIVVNGVSLTVIGVAQKGFDGTVLGVDPDLFVPMSMRPELHSWFDLEDLENRRSYWAYAFARLAPGATIEQASEELNRFYSGVITEVELPLQTMLTEEAVQRFRTKQLLLEEGWRGQSSMHAEVATPFTLLLVITGLVLLIACANIANLLLARGATRSTEMAVRGSLGASRWQLLRRLLTESMLLAVIGGAASLIVANWTLAGIARFLPPEAWEGLGVEIDGGVLLFTAGVSLLTGIVFGLYPALAATRPDLATLIRAGSGKDSGARSSSRFRNVLVTAQIALSMALLVSAGLFIRSLNNVTGLDLGLDAERVVQFNVAPALSGYTPEETLELFVRMEERLRALPGVSGVTASTVPILAGSSWGSDVSVEGFEWQPGAESNSRYSEVGPGYFSTMGQPLIAGREFTEADRLGATSVAIVNEAFAAKFGLDPREAVGKRMARGTGPEVELDMEIVGVVRDARYSDVKDEIPPVFAVPYRQNDGLVDMNFYLRAAGDPDRIVEAIRAEVRALDPNLPVENLRMLQDQINENIVLDRFVGTLSLAFAILATLLAAIGLYGVLSYAVAQRTREIGVRMALGAGAEKVQRMVLRQVLGMTVMGGVLGTIAALALGRAAESILYGVDGTDPLVIVIVAGLLGSVAFLAGWLPARRAAGVDPMEALRS